MSAMASLTPGISVGNGPGKCLSALFSGVPTIWFAPDAHQGTILAVNRVLVRACNSWNCGQRLLAAFLRGAFIVGARGRIGSDDQEVFAGIQALMASLWLHARRSTTLSHRCVERWTGRWSFFCKNVLPKVRQVADRA